MLPLIAWWTIPSFKNRVQYIAYDFYESFKPASTAVALNDGARIRSWKAGVHLIQNNPIAGTGIGDLQQETLQWYQTYHPGLQYFEQLMISSEWLLYAAAGGLIGWLAIVGSLFCLLQLIKRKKNAYIAIVVFLSLLACSYDIPLEGQNAVFVYSFFLCWFAFVHRYETTH
jgi:O-antigen ligase